LRTFLSETAHNERVSSFFFAFMALLESAILLPEIGFR